MSYVWRNTMLLSKECKYSCCPLMGANFFPWGYIYKSCALNPNALFRLTSATVRLVLLFKHFFSLSFQWCLKTFITLTLTSASPPLRIKVTLIWDFMCLIWCVELWPKVMHLQRSRSLMYLLNFYLKSYSSYHQGNLFDMLNVCLMIRCTFWACCLMAAHIYVLLWKIISTMYITVPFNAK